MLDCSRAVTGVLLFHSGALSAAWVAGRAQPHGTWLADPGPGALVMGAVFLALARPALRVHPLAFGAAILPSAFLSLGLANVGCFFAGCFVGRFSTLPFALRFPRDSTTWQLNVLEGFISSNAHWSVPTHPVALYLTGLEVSLAILFLARSRRTGSGRPEPRLLWAVAIYGAGAALVSLFRDPYPGSPQPYFGMSSVGFSILSGAVAIGWRGIPGFMPKVAGQALRPTERS